MSDTDDTAPAPEPEEKQGFQFPSTMTVLVIVTFLVWLAAFLIPSGTYQHDENGVPQPYVGRQDTVNLDYRDTDGPEDCPTDEDPRGRVKVLIPFTEETNVGKFVYHCHIGEHEDNGMMQVIEVVP